MFTLQEILQATRGTFLKGSPSPIQDSFPIKGISTDSRTIKPHELFIAIPGKNFDGHEFVNQAIRRSASLAIVSRRDLSLKNGTPVILVKDTIQALGQIARFHRDRFRIPVVAVTGSAGKTTTKEMLAQVLQGRYSVLKNTATENNHIGVPLTLLRLNHSHQMAVVELGTNQPGNIRWLRHVANPTIGILTNIGASHLECLKTPEGVFKEKLELIKNLRSPAPVVLNADDSYLRKILGRFWGHKILTYGIKEEADYQASSITIENDLSTRFQVNGEKSFVLGSPARHNVYNALAAIACARLFKISYPMIKTQLAQVNFPKGRQQVYRKGAWSVIDDSYNANPVSMRSALETLSQFQTRGRRILVFADMLELGSQSRSLHIQVGKMVARSQVDGLISLGPLSRFVSQTAKKENPSLDAYHCTTLNELHQRLQGYCQPEDVILVKGSRGMQMERTVQFLIEASGAS